MTKLDFSDILKYIIMCFPGSLSTMQWILKHFVNAAPGSAASVALHTTEYSTQQHRCWGSWVESISGSTLGRLGYTHHTELQLPASPRYSCSCGCHWISLLQAAFGRRNRRAFLPVQHSTPTLPLAAALCSSPSALSWGLRLTLTFASAFIFIHWIPPPVSFARSLRSGGCARKPTGCSLSPCRNLPFSGLLTNGCFISLYAQ